MAEDRKISRKSFGGYRLISVKEPGIPWEGCIWVKDIKSIKEFDALDEEQRRAITLLGCPRKVSYYMNFPTEYPYVQSGCKKREGDSDNCPFLFRYSSGSNYDCRLAKKTASLYNYEFKTF